MEQQFIPLSEKINMKGIKKLFTGNLILNFNFIFLYANIIGYITIIFGLIDLTKVDKRFSRAKPLAFILIIFSFLKMLGFDSDTTKLSSYIFNLIFFAIDFIIIFITCSIFANISKKYNEITLHKLFRLCWLIYLISNIVMIFAFNVTMIILSIIFHIGANVFFLVLLVLGYKLHGKYEIKDIQQNIITE
ncbi:MAG: hypothetical protein A2Y15_08360 [Clostridiales bacterium GWF2_36_10]|nr:MAG: hypothetical protein A2Y15_08360 [Clostridiales bacterium GWF2_36_10]HAN20314.1 hypothetical protein [Clostridiales bacterium]